MCRVRGRRNGIAALMVLALGLTVYPPTAWSWDEEPAEKKPAERQGQGLAPFFQGLMRGLFAPPGQMGPRVRAGNSATAERANGARDAIDARAPRNPKLDGLWTASNTAVRQSDWKHAVELLQRLLDSPEDAVYRAKGGRWESLRTAASRQLGQAPPEILTDYERQYGGLADQLWTEAHRAGRIDAVVEVATRFLHTTAGRKAANFLAHWHFDRAEFALAVRWFSDLDAVNAPESRDPRWRMKAAYAARHASPDQMRHFLNPALSDPRADAIDLGGKTVSVAEGWSRLPGQSPQTTPVLNQWPQLFGTAARVGIAAGNPPLLKPEWSAPLTANSALRRRLDWILQDLEDEQQIPMMVGMPLVLGDKIAFRDLRGVRMVDAATGKTLWATTEGLSPERILSGIRTEDTDDEDFPGGGFFPNPDDDYSGPSAEFHPLVSHLFRDATIGLISSDTRQLYALEDVATLTRSQQGHQWDGEGEPVDPFGANWRSNRLTAYSVATGRRLWSVGGRDGRDLSGTLAGCFFLGAPVVDGDDLLVVGAVGEEIRLLALDPASGTLKWSQLLAYADTKIDLDVVRRWVSTPIAAGQGILICPTTVGWLVAVDRTRRTVLWAHRYLPEDEDGDLSGDGGSLFQSQRELNGQWLATPPVMAGSKVIFTPSDGDVVVCLDLTQGKLQWQEDREDGLYLAGVVDERVLIVGQSAVVARDLDDGEEAWTHEWDDGVYPNGRAAIVGDQLYVPMSDGTLRLIDWKTGKEAGKLSTWPGEPALGSLVKAGRRLFAYGPRGVQMFDEQPGVLAEIEQRKAMNPADAEALIREAELWLLTPRYADAARQLLAVSEQGLPSELTVRRHVVLWQALVGMIQSNAPGADAALKDMAAIANTADEKLSVELFRIDREVTAGRLVEAFDAYWQLAERDDGPATIVRPHQPQLQVQRRIWLQGKMNDLWDRVEGDLRKQLDAKVQAAVSAALKDESFERLVKLTGWCDFHPAAARLHWKLSEELAKVRDFGHAEQQLLPWADHARPDIAAETNWRLAQLDRQFGLIEDALLVERMLRTRYGDVMLSTGQTIQDALATRPADAALVTPALASTWDRTPLETQQIGTQYAPPVQEVISPVDSPFLSQFLIQAESNDQRLTFADRRNGRWRWLAPLRGSPRAQDYGDMPTAVLGRSVIVLHRDVFQRLSPVDQRVMWTKTLEGHNAGGGLHHDVQRPMPQALQLPSSEEGDHEALFSHLSPHGHLAAVFPNYLCLQGRRSLTVYDPLSGRECWTRTGVAPQAMIFPGRDWLCVVEMEDDKVTVYRTTDGQPVEAQGLQTRLRRSLRLLGNDLIQLESQAGLRLFNLASGRTILRRTELLTGRELWKQDFAPKTEVGLIDEHLAMAVDAPAAGRTSKRGVTIVRLDNGERQTLAPIALPTADGEFYPLADAECIYLIANHGEGNTYHYGDSLTTLPVNGTVCCWDRITGELLWSREVEDQNLVLERFAPSPVLLFLTRSWKQKANTSFTLLNLLAIGKRSGMTLHESSTPSMFGGFHTLTLREHESTIELASYNLKLRLVPRREPVAGSK